VVYVDLFVADAQRLTRKSDYPFDVVHFAVDRFVFGRVVEHDGVPPLDARETRQPRMRQSEAFQIDLGKWYPQRYRGPRTIVQLRHEEVIRDEQALLHRRGGDTEQVKDERPYDQHDHEREDQRIAPFTQFALPAWLS